MASDGPGVVAMTACSPVSGATLVLPRSGQGEGVVKFRARLVLPGDTSTLPDDGDDATIDDEAPRLPEWFRDRA